MLGRSKEEAEGEAVDGRLEEAEAKEKLTAVPSLAKTYYCDILLFSLSPNHDQIVAQRSSYYISPETRVDA